MVTSGQAKFGRNLALKDDISDIWQPNVWDAVPTTSTYFNIPDPRIANAGSLIPIDPNTCVPFVLKNTSGADITIKARGIYDLPNTFKTLVVFNGTWNLEKCLEIVSSDGVSNLPSGLTWGINRN